MSLFDLMFEAAYHRLPSWAQWIALGLLVSVVAVLLGLAYFWGAAE